MWQRWGVLIYGVLCYGVAVATMLYAVGFIGNIGVPRSLDSPSTGSLLEAALVNLALLVVFGLQHSVMARPGFKRWWTRFVPEPMERSTYVLFSSMALALLFALWRPMGGVVWDIQNVVLRALMYVLFAYGWLIVLVTTFLIDHFDLFGLRQVWLYFRGLPYEPRRFVTPGPYRLVRHPLYVGWLVVFWAAPTMTLAHLLFALGLTVYILIAIPFEERDLLAALGRSYADYRARVPMLIPGWSRRASQSSLDAK
jgi:protein-S-isoprenylcysteine O-methyltransferase Ste14